MTTTTAKIVLAIGVTALFTSIVLIAAFAGFLYFRTTPDTARGPVISSGPTAAPTTRSRRGKGPITVSVDEITEIRLRRSMMSSTYGPKPAAYFGNINVQNFTSSTSELSFTSDGIAIRVSSSEETVDGVKTSKGPTRYVVNIGTEAFRSLANVLVENDFANEPRSREISSLPISVILTVVHSRGETVIEASNMNKDTPEMTAILKAIDALDKKTQWEAGLQ